MKIFFVNISQNKSPNLQISDSYLNHKIRNFQALLKPCYKLLEWGQWSQCPKTCAQSLDRMPYMYRRQRCIAIDDRFEDSDPERLSREKRLSSRAQPCNGTTLTETKPCDVDLCPNWANWSDWTPCSASCGPSGVRVKSRECMKNNQITFGCTGRVRDQENCNTQACPIWTSWSNWSECDSSCGMGKQTRDRLCQQEFHHMNVYDFSQVDIFYQYWFYYLYKFKANQAIGLNFSDIDSAKVSCRGPNIRFRNLTTSISAVQTDEIPCFNKCGASRQIARDPLFLIVNGEFNDWKRDKNFNGVFKKINRNKIPKAIDKTGNRSVYK